MGKNRLPVKVGHEAALQFHKFSQHVTGLFIKKPGYAVGAGAVQTAVRAQQAELAPSFVNIRRSRAFKSADVMAPESKACAGKGQSAS